MIPELIFFDAEFSSLDPKRGEMLSLGFITTTGEELYLELEHEGYISPWATEHVLPYLKGPKVARPEARKQIAGFLGTNQPRLISYVNAYDVLYMHKLFEVDENTKLLPYNWLSLDFASVLFAKGYKPDIMVTAERQPFMQRIGIDNSKFREHHALDDAKLLKEVYLKLQK